MFSRAGRQHLLADPPLTKMKRRGIDIHDDFGACRCLETGRTVRQPHILANVNPNRRAAQTNERQPPARMKITAFVEHTVIRQIPLTIGRDQFLIGNDRRRIVEFMYTSLHHR